MSYKLDNIINPASEMHALTPDNELVQACEDVMRAIRKASDRGYYRVVFDPRPNHLYETVKAEFATKGYTFTSVGVVGGVRQLDEYICW